MKWNKKKKTEIEKNINKQGKTRKEMKQKKRQTHNPQERREGDWPSILSVSQGHEDELPNTIFSLE